jgi:hypothetical protein
LSVEVTGPPNLFEFMSAAGFYGAGFSTALNWPPAGIVMMKPQ